MIRDGCRVKIHYTLTVDGETWESTAGKEPLSYVQGEGQLFSGLEERLLGGRAGEKRSIEIPPEKGFGQPDPADIHKMPKSILCLPDNMKPGQYVSGNLAGDPFRARIVAIDSREITLDMNHPLAGKTLHFEVEVVEVLS